MKVEDLKIASPSLAALLLEACGDRTALAAHLVAEVSALAEQLATSVERERCASHLFIVERHAGAMPIASDAIRSGAPMDEAMRDRYMRVATERRTPTLTVVRKGTDK
ncbi:MAG: hypothetical protein JWN04_3846 [Myxococcaceae bacterium]|nr:hypothetical protein [Myxococcaceae bacterium]